MSSSRGVNVGGHKQWKRKVFCCHGVCSSNTMDSNFTIKMIPFPKPCALYYSSILNLTNSGLQHNTKACNQCKKCLYWMHLCRRADDKFKKLSDINRHTYICSKHFFNSEGPSVLHPDPFPADKSGSELAREVSKRRNPCTRLPPVKGKKKSIEDNLTLEAMEEAQHTTLTTLALSSTKIAAPESKGKTG